MIQKYKEIQKQGMTPREQNKQLFNSIGIWIKEGVMSKDKTHKIECLFNAQELINNILIYFPYQVPEYEYDIFENILLSINKKITYAIKNLDNISPRDFKEEIEGIESLKKIFS